MAGIRRAWSIWSIACLAPALAANVYTTNIGARCDLRSASLVGTSSCIPFDSLDGKTLRVPSGTTRIATDGFVFCTNQSIAGQSTDIVYVVDQSRSMAPGVILPQGNDTIVYDSDCLYGGGLLVPFRGSRVQVVSPGDSTSAKGFCSLSGDPTNSRAKIVQDAMNLQAAIGVGSYAGLVSFGTNFMASNMTMLSDPVAKANLLQQVKLESRGGTNYREPLGWARLLLQGGHDSTNPSVKKPASPNPRKAIIMISDGDPNDVSYMQALDPRITVHDSAGAKWVLDSDSTPPIYGIFLSNSVRSGRALEKLAIQSKGQFIVIPPNNPDSLKRVMARILGAIVKSSTPDTLRITNTSNGQVSSGVASQIEGGGVRIRLDSIVGLKKGSNNLELRAKIGNASTSTIRWNVVVGDSASMFAAGAADSTLTATCMDASRISLWPSGDSTRPFADPRDTALAYRLDVANIGQQNLSGMYWTSVSMDSGRVSGVVTSAKTGARLTSSGSIAWRLAVADVQNGNVETMIGWDTARLLYRTPRDPRDFALAILPLFHPAQAWLKISPDTSRTLSGTLRLRVRDAGAVGSSVQVRVFHRLGDTVVVTMLRDTGAEFQGSVSFTQGVPSRKGDSLLQTGALRADAFDTVKASYSGGLRDSSLLGRPAARLRFLDGAGRPVDSLPGANLVVGASTSLRVGLFVDTVLLTQSDSVSVRAPVWLQLSGSPSGAPATGFRLSNGTAILWIRGSAPGTNGRVALSLAPSTDSLTFRPINVSAFQLRFVRAGNVLSDTLSIERDIHVSASVQVQVWNSAGWCKACFGSLRWIPSDPKLQVTDSAGSSTVLRIAGGTGWLSVRADLPVVDASLDLVFDSLSASAKVGPIQFLTPGPDSAEVLDADGDGGLDLVRVHLRTAWNPMSVIAMSWPDSNRILDLGHANVALSADSLTVEYRFPNPVSPGTTSWTNAPVRGTWVFQMGAAPRSFPVREEIAPIPLRARIGRGPKSDTLFVTASERVDPARWLTGSELVRKTGAGANLLAAHPFQWNATRREIALVFPSDSMDLFVLPGDSVRFPAHGAIADALGNRPGVVAASVVVVGMDRPPRLAEVYDADADGRADRIVLRFDQPPRVADSFSFGWPSRAGAIQYRVASRSQGVASSNGTTLTFPVSPFEFGATSCPGGGCVSLGRMWSSLWGDSLQARFDEVDSVAPVIVSGSLRFAASWGLPDTLRAEVSEPIRTLPGKEWLRWGRPSRDSLGLSIGRIREDQLGSTSLLMILDSSFQGRRGDSLRLGPAPMGGLSDVEGVAPKRFAHWAPLEVGPFPIRFALTTWHPIVLDSNWVIPRSESPLSLFVRSSPLEKWKTLDGRDPGQDPSHYAGIVIRANRSMDAASVYLYDNIATAVAFLDLSPLREALRNGEVKTTLRGDFEALVAWNGTSTGGKKVSGGIYPIRFLAWHKDSGKTEFVNRLFRLGWIIPQPYQTSTIPSASRTSVAKETR